MSAEEPIKGTRAWANWDMERLGKEVLEGGLKASDEQWEEWNLRFDNLPDEVRLACWSLVTSNLIDRIDLAKRIHKNWCNSILDIFGKRMNENGDGVDP